jgi:hypothetical protein
MAVSLYTMPETKSLDFETSSRVFLANACGNASKKAVRRELGMGRVVGSRG